MFFKTIAKFDTFQFICGTPTEHLDEPPKKLELQT